jgi:hypothetical protein
MKWRKHTRVWFKMHEIQTRMATRTRNDVIKEAVASRA